MRRLSAELESQRPRTAVASSRDAKSQVGSKHLALVSPRLRPRDFREASPENGLAAAARLAAAVASATSSSFSPLGAAGVAGFGGLRPRRHSALAGASTYAPPVRSAWRATSPREAEEEKLERRPSRSSAASSMSRVAPGEVAVPVKVDSAKVEVIAPEATEDVAPEFVLRPRVQRAQSVLRPERPAALKRSSSADPVRCHDCQNSDECCAEDEHETAEAAEPVITRMPTSPVLPLTARGSPTFGPGFSRATRRSSTGNIPTAAAAASNATANAADKAVRSIEPRPSLHVPPFKSLASSIYSGKYSVGKFLGRGASASVWEAMRSDVEKRVAVKVFDQGQKDKRQAHREMKVLSRIQHPRVLEAYEVIETPRYAQLICELVDGESLRAYSQRQPSRKLSDDVARKLYRQVVEGVNYCHERLVVHRDLKLENLLLDRSNESVKIIDFGFAAQVASRDTKLRAFCGTPSYMAPEIIRGEGYSGFAADVWALGVVIFALLSGTLPFTGRTEMQLYAKIRRGMFTLPDCLSELPSRLIKGALRIDAASRPATGAILKHVWLEGDGKEPQCKGPEAEAASSGAPSTRSAAAGSDGKVVLQPRMKEERKDLASQAKTAGAAGLISGRTLPWHPAPSSARGTAKGYPKTSTVAPARLDLAHKIAAGGGTAFAGS
eukprot:CAMPEP_0197655744 /NCGR_PEP_ID=MMETSP1338-20131121/39640_1 /TAXON_ID=43686 ORGANISM="Pelagodinium beii, Strain RCC1491" /NCGR_SAMPLE_ID=MMETSP1338 /ASSEMBLY_ACC=CAM_ASM_000754 /LENGTH=666 /DNA_ID=CAMNT_0043231455 /DNA_START=60 /DNA_END=2060 /DNA_ORIENTATION=+